MAGFVGQSRKGCTNGVDPVVNDVQPYGKQTNFTKPYMFELFDLKADPFELVNIYNHTKATNPSLVNHLSAVTYSYYGCVGKTCPQ